MDTTESDKNITLAVLDITVSKSYLYCQITHLYIFKVHSNFAKTGIDFPPKGKYYRVILNYWGITG